MLLYFFKSWMIGLAIAAPVGPIGMLCIKKTLEWGLKGALSVGLGAALADSVYGLVASLGLSTVSSVLLSQEQVIKLLGGVFLLYLAYKEIKSTAPKNEAHVNSKTWIRLVGNVFFLTMTNPMTILSFIAIFASISTGPVSVWASIIMVFGVFLGSMTWWCLLGGIIAKIRHKLPLSWLKWIKWASCFILVAFGVFAITTSF